MTNIDNTTTINLVICYTQFCDYRQNLIDNSKIDLRQLRFIRPTTLLPLWNLISQEKNIDNIFFPLDPDVNNYIRTIITGNLDSSHNKLYIPLVKLPQDFKHCEEYMQRIYDLTENDSAIPSSVNPFHYLIGELVNNIYDHSSSSMAMVMAQKYSNLGFVELCFFDNGITIPNNFREHFGNKFDDPIDALREALKGMSTKLERGRGYGLRTSLRMCVEGLKGEFFMASGAAGVHLTPRVGLWYRFQPKNQLDGTLVTLKAPYPSPILSEQQFYRYVEDM